MEYFTRSASGAHESLKRLNRLMQQCEIIFVTQPVPRGLGDALLRCRDFIADRPFAMLFPDNVFFGKRSSIRQMVPHAILGMDMVSLYRYTPDIARWFGNSGRVDLVPFTPSGKMATATNKRLYQIKKLYDKKRGPFQMGKSKSLLVSFERYIFYPHVFDEIEKAQKESGDGEIDDVPILQSLIQQSCLIGTDLEGVGFDVGNPLGYAAANWWLANR
jgi:UTP--glucose-1-phosphate uridylyltransferase